MRKDVGHFLLWMAAAIVTPRRQKIKSVLCPLYKFSTITRKFHQVPVTHSYNPSYSRGRDPGGLQFEASLGK
jgi:hypothetical protein